MRTVPLLVAGLGAALLGPHAGPGQDRSKPVPAAKLAPPAAYYAPYPDDREKVRLSDEMANKLAEIVGRKPQPFTRTIRAAPRGYFVVGGKPYYLYGGITSDPQQGDAWDDPVLHRFWEELNRVNDELGPLKDFKP